MGFNDGYSIPLGNFRAADQNKYPISKFNGQDTTHISGYATYGFHYEYYVAYRFMPHVSIMISVGGSNLGYAINTVNSQFITYFAPNTAVVTSGDNYYVLQYMMGPKVNLRLGRGFYAEFVALGGMITTNYPSIAYIGMPHDTVTNVYSFPQGSGYNYDIGATLKFAMENGHVGIRANINYVGSTVKFPNYSVAYFHEPDPAAPSLSNLFLGAATFNTPKTLDVSMLQISLGLSIEY